MSKKQPPPIQVTHRKLGKHKAVGLAWLYENRIEIDSRAQGQEHLYLMVHEILHILNPKWSEVKIIHQARRIAETLWEQNYRRVDQ